ncbi:hypothetical protein PZE06_08540 [Robertmurraya sp. DFI.2.37]|jgi:hypothetical protein|uniref:hypothetical protein n=1 Tax=Robertmurraya sp. DFI.2.37 TaxID=3031819 RepID=UPI0012475FAE|nr:hypothetical protein [Robertmurraya sp. DFI.2.37]MDF1508232.1 hypothetical protein [Robertmurraya sp. DFI.2.37]
MIHLKVKTKDIRFSIPIPYAILDIGISVLSSKLVQQQLSKRTKTHSEEKKWDYSLPSIEKEMLKPIIRELKNYKGLVLVDIKDKEGTEVHIRL